MTTGARRWCGVALLGLFATACGTPSTTTSGRRVEALAGTAPVRSVPAETVATPPATTITPTTIVATTTLPATTVPPTTLPSTTAPITAPPTLPPTLPPPPPPTQAPQPFVSIPSNGDPNYSGCVPIATDVDCAGGSGNGPAYVQGPVYVVGEDIYGLDGNDNDGIGCEG